MTIAVDMALNPNTHSLLNVEVLWLGLGLEPPPPPYHYHYAVSLPIIDRYVLTTWSPPHLNIWPPSCVSTPAHTWPLPLTCNPIAHHLNATSSLLQGLVTWFRSPATCWWAGRRRYRVLSRVRCQVHTTGNVPVEISQRLQSLENGNIQGEIIGFEKVTQRKKNMECQKVTQKSWNFLINHDSLLPLDTSVYKCFIDIHQYKWH